MGDCFFDGECDGLGLGLAFPQESGEVLGGERALFGLDLLQAALGCLGPVGSVGGGTLGLVALVGKAGRSLLVVAAERLDTGLTGQFDRVHGRGLGERGFAVLAA